MKSRITIDPLNLEDESRRLLSIFLSRCRHGQLIRKGKTYFVGLRRITFTHNAVVRQKTPGVWHCDVVDDKDCGSGKFGSAYKILAVLDFYRHGIRNDFAVDIKDKRVYKFQKNAAVHEARLMKRCPHLQARELFAGVPSMISMRKFPGLLLNDALNNDRRLKPFTHAQRYRITIALLRALKRQIHDNMICHRDIKPDNIFYDPDTGEINIFDLGVSQLIYFSYDRRSRGNATFSSPEDFICVRTQQPVTISEFRSFSAMESEATVKSDIYSMARVIGLVWRDSNPIFFVKNADHTKLMLRRILKQWEPGFELFQNLKSVSDEERSGIESQLLRMTAISPSERPDLDACIEYFDRMFLNYKLSKVNPSSREMLKRSHALALTAQQQLDNIEIQHDLILRLKKAARKYNINHDVPLHGVMNILRNRLDSNYKILSIETGMVRDRRHFDDNLPLRDFIAEIADETSLASLHMYLQSTISSLDDHPFAVAEFIETLGCKCLAGIKSKLDLIKQVDQIINSFTDHLQQLLQISDASEQKADQAALEDLNHLFAEISSSRMNLDEIKKISDHMNKKIHKLTVIAPINFAP